MDFDSGPIMTSLERAGELCGDITPLVYQRLFNLHPEITSKFVLDKSNAVKGEMLARAIEAILDFIGPRLYARTLISSEAQNHDTFGIPRDTFGSFFPMIADTVREALGGEWTEEMDRSWSAMLMNLDGLTRHADS